MLVEFARSDHVIDERERQTIINALRQACSEFRSDIESVKIRLIEHMWRVATADGDLHKYEEYTIRKLADLLYVKHRDFLQARLQVIDDA